MLHLQIVNSMLCVFHHNLKTFMKKKILEWEVGGVHYFQRGNLTTAFSTKNIEVRRQLNDILQEKKRIANLDFYAQ